MADNFLNHLIFKILGYVHQHHLYIKLTKWGYDMIAYVVLLAHIKSIYGSLMLLNRSSAMLERHKSLKC